MVEKAVVDSEVHLVAVGEEADSVAAEVTGEEAVVEARREEEEATVGCPLERQEEPWAEVGWEEEQRVAVDLVEVGLEAVWEADWVGTCGSRNELRPRCRRLSLP